MSWKRSPCCRVSENKNGGVKNTILTSSILWYLQESNQGHKDFQSFALPTELRYQPLLF